MQNRKICRQCHELYRPLRQYITWQVAAVRKIKAAGLIKAVGEWSGRKNLVVTTSHRHSVAIKLIPVMG